MMHTWVPILFTFVLMGMGSTMEFLYDSECPYCDESDCPKNDICPLCAAWKRDCCDKIEGELRCEVIGCYCKIDVPQIPPGKDCGKAYVICETSRKVTTCYRCPLEKMAPNIIYGSGIYYCHGVRAIMCTKQLEPVAPPYKEPVEPPYKEPVEPPYKEPVEPPYTDPIEPSDQPNDNVYQPPVSNGVPLKDKSLWVAAIFSIVAISI